MLGVAYFVVDTGHLYIMPDAAEREDFGLLRRGEFLTICVVGSSVVIPAPPYTDSLSSAISFAAGAASCHSGQR